MLRRTRFFASIIFFALLFAALFQDAGEAAKKQPPPPDGVTKPSEVVWTQETDGLAVTLEASEQLNSLYGVPLAVTVCIYQLSDLAKFSALATSFEGIEQLLEGKIDLLGGTAMMSRIEYIQPGVEITRILDRMEGAKYVGVVVGYAHRDPKRCSAYAPFPLKETVIKTKRLLRRAKKDVYYTAGTLEAKVFLGSGAVTIDGGAR